MGSRSTLGATSQPVRPLRPTTREFRADAAGPMPFLDHFLDRMEGLVERVGLIHPNLASTVTDHERWLCARLLITLSFIDVFPQQDRHNLRSVARLFQLRAIQGVQGLRRELAAPTPDLPPSSLWITRFTAQHYKPREKVQNIPNMVGAPVGTTRKRKRPDERGPTVIDTETWLQEARQANDMDASLHVPSSNKHTLMFPPGKRPEH